MKEKSNNLEIVVQSFESAGFPHLERLRASNPGPTIHTHCGKEAGEPKEKLDYWRNADREIRNWWKRNHERVAADFVLFIEGDVLVNYDLTKLVEPGVDLVGAHIVGEDEPWKWRIDALFLPEILRSKQLGIVPLAFLLFSRRALDHISAPEWDQLYLEDIFCELRTPTLVNAAGFVIRNDSALAGCQWHPVTVPLNTPGIWHAVKK